MNSWYDPPKEADAATALIDQGADIITQHTDSPAALRVCEERDLLAFGQSWDMTSFAPKAHLTAIMDIWGPYYIDRIQKVMDKKWESADTWWGFKEGIVALAPYNERIPADVVAEAEAIKAGIIDGSYDVFTGPIKDQSGKVRLAEGRLTDGDLLSMDWYVEGVQS